MSIVFKVLTLSPGENNFLRMLPMLKIFLKLTSDLITNLQGN